MYVLEKKIINSKIIKSREPMQVVYWILKVSASLRTLQITSTAVAAVVQVEVAAECFHGQKPRTPAAVGQPARTAERI
jgi:hypothetical protein